MTGDDVNDHYYYLSNFANGLYGIWFCGTQWYISPHPNKNKGKCLGLANSDYNIEKCVNDIGFEWKYAHADVAIWGDAGEGLAVKCLYVHGN